MNADGSKIVLGLANAVTVSGQELLRVNEETENLPAEDRSVEAGMFKIARLYRGDFRKAIAVFFRMTALANLLQTDEGIPGWTLPQLPDGSIPTEKTVFAAAAIQPLIEVNGEVAFERDTFMTRVLELAELEIHG